MTTHAPFLAVNSAETTTSDMQPITEWSVPTTTIVTGLQDAGILIIVAVSATINICFLSITRLLRLNSLLHYLVKPDMNGWLKDIRESSGSNLGRDGK